MKIIYLDNCATTRVDDEVVDAMLPYLREDFGNPSSPHVLGKRARRAVDLAAVSVAELLGADPRGIVFTSGATESNNIALLGMFAHAERAPVNALFCPTDHKSALAIGRALAGQGIDTRTMAVRQDGLIDLTDLAEQLDVHSRVATAALVNSEIGSIQPVSELAALCHEFGCLLHVDAAQAAGRIPIDVIETGVDTLAISGHKVRGPKGIGALYVRPGVRLRPITYGGGQYELRSGTIPTHLVVGLGKACELALRRLDDDWMRAVRLRETALDLITTRLPGTRINGDAHAGVPHVLNLVLPGVRGESLVSSLRSVAVSTGSACNSDSQEPSHVLTAIGVSAEDANCSIRMCLDPRMPFDELVRGIELICERALELAEVSIAMQAT
ncbi:cysteine desulfurase family protein [Nonomuraea sp. NEAU-A123]|uniref:cysteine desulfurase family protein n=1 Tax=Nonomuraea sp. NEAU-A123 TaxID=2839649 RepID=UPI001BE3D4DB|nr:cysteine desulfurase family protein [Nonomuraea sp. NEAU-A123]MBT2230350.1 cysteine desulfurase [Nonomuraea sp. NEAU-A123]